MSILKADCSDHQQRSQSLDTLATILPMDRRDRLAELLTDQDVETLRHLTKQGIGENSMRALTSDLAYLEAWARAATGHPLPWPAPQALERVPLTECSNYLQSLRYCYLKSSISK